MNNISATRPRSNTDRRVHDHPLPQGFEDRRKSPERRLPAVSYEDFDEYISIPPVAGAGGNSFV